MTDMLENMDIHDDTRPIWLTLEEIDERIARSAVTAANEIGFYLKVIRDRNLYREAGANDVWEYAQQRYGYAPSTTSRLMALNTKFSAGGNSLELEEKYKSFTKSQLMEMLPMSPEQIQTIDPEMSVRKIKAVKKEQRAKADDPDPEKIRRPNAEEKKLLAQAAEQIVESCSEWLSRDEHYNVYAKTEYPVWQLYKHEIENRPTGVSFGAEDEEYIYGVYIVPTPDEINIKDPACVEIRTGSTLIGRFYSSYLRTEIEKAWNARKLEKAKAAEKQTAKEETDTMHIDSSEPVQLTAPDPDSNPVSRETEGLLDPATITTAELPAEAEGHPKQQDESDEEKGERPDYRTDHEILKDLIKENQEWLNELIQVYTPRDAAVRKYQLMVDALKFYQKSEDPDQVTEAEIQMQGPPQKESAEKAEVRKWKQPPLPDFKNDKERKEWIRNFTAWGLWYSDGNIDVYYYRYDFEDGSWLVAEFHPRRETEWTEDVNDYCYYHLIHKRAQHYESKKLFEEQYMHQETSITYIVRFLKDLQKGKK